MRSINDNSNNGLILDSKEALSQVGSWLSNHSGLRGFFLSFGIKSKSDVLNESYTKQGSRFTIFRFLGSTGGNS